MRPFQEIVNTYSIPHYREINPACFSVVTFPFLFGVMFGDIGHGLLLILFASYIFIFERNIRAYKQSILNSFVEFRFIILMFGLFSFYCGLIYNEFFSIPVPMFGTCYNRQGDSEYVKRRAHCVYPFGLDPIWNVSKNELNFLNSLKMKLSIIIGVLHMLLGIVLSGINSINKREYSDIFTVFLPKFIFMAILFGYLSVMIVFKWLTDWDNMTLKPPSLINQFLNIFLKAGVIVSFYFICNILLLIKLVYINIYIYNFYY